jgi:two-component system chemotaxis response regulator CheB
VPRASCGAPLSEQILTPLPESSTRSFDPPPARELPQQGRAAEEPDPISTDHRDIVVVGGSAGAVEALTELVRGLPADLDAAVFAVVHVAPHARSALPAILNRVGALPAAAAADHEPIRPGRIYVATPDRHLLIDGDRIRVTRGPRENGHRPAVDVLFRSAARSVGPRAVGVVLSGTLDDGTVGLAAIKRAGGVGVVQGDAAFAEMPANALRGAEVDHVVALAEMAGLIVRLVGEPVDVALHRPTGQLVVDAPTPAPEETGEGTGIVCPECGGALWEIGTDPVRFRCRVGHAYGMRSLLSANSTAVEQAMWAALRSLEERAALLKRIGARFAQRDNARQAERFDEDAEALLVRAKVIRDVLLDPDLAGEAADGDEGVAEELP